MIEFAEEERENRQCKCGEWMEHTTDGWLCHFCGEIVYEDESVDEDIVRDR